jgi:Cu+-exporting ATPase
MREGVATEVPLTEIVIGEKVVVSPESTIPVDGIVLEGISSVSTALLTGESMPHPISPGSSTVAGALNHDGKLLIEVTAVGAGSHIARIAALVAAAQSGRANIARLADRISAIFVPAVLLLTVATGIVWTLFIDSSRTIDVVIAVLVIACPCALGLATPTALVVGSGRAAKLGFIVSGPEIFEQARNVDVVVFDKTGTLTTGEMKVSQLSVPPMWQPALAALSRASAHPISVATADALRSLTSVELTGVTTMPGRGIRGKLNDDVIEFGSRHLYPDLALTPEGAATQSWLFVNGEVVGWVSVTDTVDPTAAEAVRILHARGVHTVMASGDLAPVARNVGQQFGITDIRAELKPEEKIAIIQEFRSAGKIVAMVGDGTNDAPALAAADIGIAMGRGTEVARATADITLLRPDVRLIPTALSLSQATLRTIKQNLGWAFGYNLAALPLAMSGQLNPVIAGIAMSASSVLVVTNSLRLRRSSLLS